MIETSSDDAATDLWTALGAGGGLATADASLGLRRTTPGPGDYWGLTTTTAGDQLRLLTGPRDGAFAAGRTLARL